MLLLLLYASSFSFVFQFIQFVCFWPNTYSANNSKIFFLFSVLLTCAIVASAAASSGWICFEIVLERYGILFDGTIHLAKKTNGCPNGQAWNHTKTTSTSNQNRHLILSRSVLLFFSLQLPIPHQPHLIQLNIIPQQKKNTQIVCEECSNFCLLQIASISNPIKHAFSTMILISF